MGIDVDSQCFCCTSRLTFKLLRELCHLHFQALLGRGGLPQPDLQVSHLLLQGLVVIMEHHFLPLQLRDPPHLILESGLVIQQLLNRIFQLMLQVL